MLHDQNDHDQGKIDKATFNIKEFFLKKPKSMNNL